MIPEIDKIKGIHPGAVLRRELKHRRIKGKDFAARINEHAQTISAILNERRNINPKLSIKLGQELGVDNDYFEILQAYHNVKIAESDVVHRKTPNLKNFRKTLFWDTKYDKIDWIKNRRAIIKRVLERGNEKEILELLDFYGKELIRKEMRSIDKNFLPSLISNMNKYINVNEII